MPAQMIRIMVGSMPAVGHHPPRRLTLLGVLVSLLGVSACGSHVVIVDSSEVRLRLDEFRITPQTVQVHAGRIKIAAFNVGVQTHDVEVQANYLQKDGNPIAYNKPVVLKPGENVTFKVTLRPGRYKLIDTVANHADLGDYGTLIVVP
jgi:uncharacterized cupredoxin-like copper-binding protein